MKTITVVFAAVVILIVGNPGSVPFLVLCSTRGGADYNRFASSSLLTQAILAAEYVRLNGVFKSPRKKEEKP